jgi:hypothetical protein
MKNVTTRQAIFWLAVAAPVVIHFTLLFLYSVNAPRLDDFSEILTFLPDWHAADNSIDKLSVLFRDYQNHRYVFYHALLVIFDHINFRNAAIIGNLPLVLLSGMLITVTKHHPSRIAICIITPLLLFNLQTWRAMFWGPLGTSNLFYPCIALLTCRLATLDTRGVFLAGVMTLFLTLAHGSGPLLLPVIAAYLWIQKEKDHYIKSVFMGWIIFSSLTLLLYFVIFPLEGSAGYSSHSNMALLQNIFLQAGKFIGGFFALIGSILLDNNATQVWKHPLAIALGALELFWLIWLLSQGALNKYPALLMWLAFLLLTIASIASGRVTYAGIDQAMQGHYKLLNGIFLWFICIATLEWIQRAFPAWQRRAEAIALSVALSLYIGAAMLFFPAMKTYQTALADDATQWLQSGKLTQAETQLYVKQPNKKIKAAFDGGFYDPRE